MRFFPCTVLALAVVASACDSSPSASSSATAFRATTSFGFCLGYCRTSLEITPEEMVFTEESPRGELPPVRRTARLTAGEWNELVVAVDRSALERLPGTLGCPDCADGGAESLGVIATDWRKEVTFEFGAPVPELQPLLARVRALRERFTPTPDPRR